MGRAYISFQCSRLNKTGGGVALYINETLQPNYLPTKSKCNDNCAEIVTVEVTLANGKKVLVSCVYRAPNTNVDILSDFIIPILRNNRNKTIYVSGDFNIDLLQSSGRNKEIISLVRRTSVTSNLLVRHSHHLSNK